MQEIKQQVDRLEWRVDSHEEQLSQLSQNTADLRSMLDSINKTLSQIKWLVIGGVVVYCFQQTGFAGLLELVR